MTRGGPPLLVNPIPQGHSDDSSDSKLHQLISRRRSGLIHAGNNLCKPLLTVKEVLDLEEEQDKREACFFGTR